MKNRKEHEKIIIKQEIDGYVVTSSNVCVACGREIPEGMLVCMDCKIGKFEKRCTICNRPIDESESICSICDAIIFRSKK